jgi:hypothetical protein
VEAAFPGFITPFAGLGVMQFPNRYRENDVMRRTSAPARSRQRLRLETLEGRLAPAVVNWTLGADGDFANPLAWTDQSNGTHHVPGAADDAAIVADVTVTSSINQSLNSLNNSGAIRINSGTFALANGFTQTDGSTEIATGAVLQSPYVELDGGSLGGAGTVIGNVSGDGTISPGPLPGVLTVNGNVDLSGPLVIEIAGTGTQTMTDQLKVTGTLSLSGPLNITGTASVASGTQIVIVDNAGTGKVQGNFANLGQGATFLAGGQDYFISYVSADGNDICLVAYPTPIRVASVRINDGAAQRSEVRSLTVTFSGKADFEGGDDNAAAAFQLRHFTHAENVDLSADVSLDDQGRTVVTLTFSGPETDPESAKNGSPPSLTDGRYTFTVFNASVTGADNGLALDGTGDGFQGDDWVSPRDTLGGTGLHLYRIFGDATGDGTVDALDLVALRTAINTSAGDPNYQTYWDGNNDGFIDASDLQLLRSRYNNNVVTIAPPPTFYVNPATGNDANDGRSATTAWATWGRLVAAVQDGTISAGEWEAPDGSLADITTIPTVAQKDAWYAAYLAGQRFLTGATIVIDTSAVPLQVTAPLDLPAGCEIRSATSDNANLLTNVAISGEVWSQPNAAAYPAVWDTTSSTDYSYAVLYEQVNGQWAQLAPTSVPDLATALPLLQQRPGSFWVDPTTNRLYTHALAGGNPNVDGVNRQRSVNFFGTSGGRVIDVRGGMASHISVDGGFGYLSTDPNVVYGNSGLGIGDWDEISVIDSCVVSRAGRHSFSTVGTLAIGFTIMRNDVATLGPGGIFPGAWSLFVDYSAYAGIGSAYSIYDGCSTINGVSNVGAPGGSDPTGNLGVQPYLSFFAHNNGIGMQFAERLIENCVFRGMSSLKGAETAQLITRSNTFGDAASASFGTWTSTNDTFQTQVPAIQTASATFTSPIMVPSGAYAGASSTISGTVNINGGIMNLSGGDFYTTAWTRSGPLRLTISGTNITLFPPNTTYGLVYLFTDTDSFTMTGGANVNGSPDIALLGSYNGSPTPKSWQWARNAGMVDATVTLYGAAWAATPFASRATFTAGFGTPLASYTPEAGPRFTNVSGNATITSGQANLTGNSVTALSWVNSGRSTGLITTIISLSSAGGANGGIVFNGVDANNYWVAALNGSTLFLYEYLNGAYVVRGSYETGAANGSKHTLTVDPEGDTVSVTWDAGLAPAITYTATNRRLKSATFTGLLEFANGTALFDDFDIAG